MDLSEDRQFALDLSDLDEVVELLFDSALVDGEKIPVRDLIYSDLEKLPSADIWPFSITFSNSFTSTDPEQGSSSEWVSIDANDYEFKFSVGNHSHTPGIGGDTFSETIFECWGGGYTEGYLSDWLSHLKMLDRESIKISINHELQGCDHPTEPSTIEVEVSNRSTPSLSTPTLLRSKRESLIDATRKASDDPRLSSELRDKAKHSLRNLLAIFQRHHNN